MKECEHMTRRLDGIYCKLTAERVGEEKKCPYAYYCGICGNKWKLDRSKVLLCETRARGEKK